MTTDFKLIDTGWDSQLTDAAKLGCSLLRIICPFIQKRPVERLLDAGQARRIQVITRYNLDQFAEGVNDIAALQTLLKHGASIRGIRNLHAKLFLFGDRRAIVTSANLTDAGLGRNHEFGFVSDDPAIVTNCNRYFDDLWGRTDVDLVEDLCAKWERTVKEHLLRGAAALCRIRLGDEGVDIGISSAPLPVPAWIMGADQAFIKFSGESHDRAPKSKLVLDELDGSGSHWACAYPQGQRPRQPKDGAIMFMGRLVQPNDTMIYGRAIAFRHVPVRDDATQADIQNRGWRNDWPHYVRVHHPEFIDGTLGDGISLRELMDALGSDAFATTQRHAASGSGNADPRRAFRQKPAVELTAQAAQWLNKRLDARLNKLGRVTSKDLARLYKPVIPKFP